MSKNETMIDRRVAERNIHEGIISRADYEKVLQTLPDVAAKAEFFDATVLAPRSYLKGALGDEPAGAPTGGTDPATGK